MLAALHTLILAFASLLAQEATPETFTAYLRAQDSPEGYTVILLGASGLGVVPDKIHVDRVALGGRVEREDVARAAGNAPYASTPNELHVPLSVARAMLRPGMQSLVLRLDPGVLTRDGAPLRVVPVDEPVHVYLPDVARDARLERRDAGAKVYTYGDVKLACVPKGASRHAHDSDPLWEARAGGRFHVVRIERALGTASILGSGFGERNPVKTRFEYKALDPLRLTFDPDLSLRTGYVDADKIIHAEPGRFPDLNSAASKIIHEKTGPLPDLSSLASVISAGGGIDGDVLAQLEHGGCQRLELTTADAWDLELLMTTMPPPPRLDREAHIHPGTTRTEVAFHFGFPSVFATREQLNAASVWVYSLPAPTMWSVVFKGDRVVEYQPPGNPP